MTESILVSLITGGLALIGVVVTNSAAGERTSAAIRTAQAVTDAKLESLTREVRDQNEFARRVPVMEEQIRVLNHRVGDLEKGESA